MVCRARFDRSIASRDADATAGPACRLGAPSLGRDVAPRRSRSAGGTSGTSGPGPGTPEWVAGRADDVRANGSAGDRDRNARQVATRRADPHRARWNEAKSMLKCESADGSDSMGDVD